MFGSGSHFPRQRTNSGHTNQYEAGDNKHYSDERNWNVPQHSSYNDGRHDSNLNWNNNGYDKGRNTPVYNETKSHVRSDYEYQSNMRDRPHSLTQHQELLPSHVVQQPEDTIMFPTIPESELVGHLKLVAIQHYENKNKFFCRLLDYDDKFQQLMECLQQECHGQLAVNCFQGNICCNKYSVDELWYRAKIEEVLENEVRVMYVDYGNVEVTSSSSLRRIKNEFRELPVQAIECSLDTEQSYSAADADKFSNFMVESTFFCWFKGPPVNTSYPVALFLEKDLNSINVIRAFERRLGGEQPAPECSKSVLESLTGVANFEELSESIATVDNKTSAEVISTQYNYITTLGQNVPSSASVIISWVVSNTKFYCNLKNYCDRLEALNERLQVVYRGEDRELNLPELQLTHEMPCVAKFHEDERWYRALVKDVQSDVTRVLFVDYGNTECVMATDLRPLIEEFAELPVQGIRCKMAFLKHCKKLTKENEGDEEECYFIHNGNNCYTVALLSSQEEISNGDLIAEGHKEAMRDVNSEVLEPEGFTSEIDELDEAPDEAVQEEEQFSYCIRELPSHRTKVKVVYIESPSLFWVQICDWKPELEVLSRQLGTICNVQRNVLDNVAVGVKCAVLFYDDEEWYRGEIMQTNPDMTAKVHFTDWGNKSMKTKDEIFELENDFDMVLPLVVPCQLSDIVHQDRWTEEALARFENWILHKKFLVDFLGRELCPCPVRLLDCGMNVAETLVVEGFCVYIDSHFEEIEKHLGGEDMEVNATDISEQEVDQTCSFCDEESFPSSKDRKIGEQDNDGSRAVFDEECRQTSSQRLEPVDIGEDLRAAVGYVNVDDSTYGYLVGESESITCLSSIAVDSQSTERICISHSDASVFDSSYVSRSLVILDETGEVSDSELNREFKLMCDTSFTEGFAQTALNIASACDDGDLDTMVHLHSTRTEDSSNENLPDMPPAQLTQADVDVEHDELMSDDENDVSHISNMLLVGPVDADDEYGSSDENASDSDDIKEMMLSTEACVASVAEQEDSNSGTPNDGMVDAPEDSVESAKGECCGMVKASSEQLPVEDLEISRSSCFGIEGNGLTTEKKNTMPDDVKETDSVYEKEFVMPECGTCADYVTSDGSSAKKDVGDIREEYGENSFDEVSVMSDIKEERFSAVENNPTLEDEKESGGTDEFFTLSEEESENGDDALKKSSSSEVADISDGDVIEEVDSTSEGSPASEDLRVQRNESDVECGKEESEGSSSLVSSEDGIVQASVVSSTVSEKEKSVVICSSTSLDEDSTSVTEVDVSSSESS